jgi:iron complex outermembrane receptor protein
MTTRHHAPRAGRAFTPKPLARAVFVACLAAGCAAAALPVHAQTAQAVSRYDIPAGPLDQALNRFAAQAGVLLAIDARLTAGKNSPGLAGAVTVEEGFRRLLDGSGLESVKGDKGYALRKASAVPPAAPKEAAETAALLSVVTVLGTRDPNVPLSNVPASISVMSRQDIATQQATAQRIEDILAREVPGFNPTNVGVRQIRGRTAQVFVNGVPTNEQLRAGNGSDLNLLAPDQLESVEVARGANSAYGFGSPGGVIALTTPRAESETLALKTRLGTSFNTSQPGGSFQTSLYQSAAQIVGDFDYHVGVSARRDGLNHDPDGKPALDFNSPAMFSFGKENVYNFDTSLGYSLGDAGSLRLTATAGYVDIDEHYDSDGAGVYRSRQSSLAHIPKGDGNYRRHQTFNLSYENANLGGSAVKLEALSSRVHEHRYDWDTFYQDQYNEYDGFRSSVTTPIDSLHRGAALTYGFDVLRNRYYNPQYDATTGQVQRYWGPDTTLESYAPYVQGQVPLGKLRLSAGVRHEIYRGEVKTGASTSGGGDIQGGDIDAFRLTLFNAGAVYSLEKGRELYAGFSQGAEISQLSRAARSAGSVDRIDPRPAKSNQYEVGLRQRGQALDYTLAAFYTESDLLSALDCSIPNEPCTPLREPREFWGVEGTLAWRIDAHWGLGGTLSWMDGIRELDNGEKRRIDSVTAPPLLVGAYVDYSPRSGWKNRVQFDYHGSRDPFADSTAWPEGKVDSVLLTHFSTSFDIGKGQLQFGVRNLFDKKYYSITSEAYNGGWLWIPEQGRRVSVSYALDW